MGAMAALFAACADNYEVAQNNFDTVANRPSAGNVVLNMTVADEGEDADAETRAFWDDANHKFAYKETDRIGALLMDEYNETNVGNSTINDYAFVDYNQTNYPFKTTDWGKTWRTPEDAALCEGNYFFTMNYESAYKYRAYVEFELDNVQPNYDEATGEHDVWAAVAKYQQNVGYAFVPSTTEDVNEVDAALVPIFAAPKFKIMNHSSLPLRVMKLIVRTHQEGPAGMPKLMPNTVVLAPLSKSFSAVQEEYPGMDNVKKSQAMVSNAILIKNGFLAENPDATSGIKVDKKDGVYEYVIDMGENYIVANGENITGCAVMPAGNYKNLDVFALVEVQDADKTTGIISLTDLEKAYWSNMDSQNGSMDVTLKPLVTQVLTAIIGESAIGNVGLKDFAVTNTNDLMFVLNLMAKGGGNHNITVKTLGDQVELTNEVYAILSDPKWSNNKLQIDGTIVIPASLESNDGIDILWTDDKVKTTIINRGVQVLDEDLVADVINEGSLTEAEDKDVTIKGDVTNRGSLVVNKITGSLNAEAGSAVVAVVENPGPDEDGVVTVGTEADVTITESAINVTNSGKLTTKGIIYWNLTNNENAIWTVNGDQELQNSGATNYGLMRVGQYKVTTVNKAKLNNDGTIDNYGNINEVYRNHGVINNYLNEDGTKAEVTVNVNVKVDEEKAAINNWGVVTVTWGNEGWINMKDKTADVFFASYAKGANEGCIENTVHGNIQNIPAAQHIIYTADGTTTIDEVLETMASYKLYTDLYIKGDYELSTGDDILRRTTGGSKESKLANITIFEGVTVNIARNQSVELGYGSDVVVTNEGTIIISHNAKLSGGDITNSGLIRKHNSGTLENKVENVGDGETIRF